MRFSSLIIQTLFVASAAFVKPRHATIPRTTQGGSDMLPPSAFEPPATFEPPPATFEPPPATYEPPTSTMHMAFDLETIDDELKRTLGKKVVLQISSLLPKVDTIGHDILHANNQFVANVLANDSMSHEFKKDIILFSIKMAQYGDDLGSFFLQQYYNIVDYSI